MAIQEVDAQQPGDIPLKRGMPVEGTRGREGLFLFVVLNEIDEFVNR